MPLIVVGAKSAGVQEPTRKIECVDLAWRARQQNENDSSWLC